MFHFKRVQQTPERQSITMSNAGADYIVSPPRDSSSLKNHYLLKHPATFIVSGIGFVLLLIMMASLPKDTAKMVERSSYEMGQKDLPAKLTPVKMQLYTPSKWMTIFPAWGGMIEEANLAPAILPSAFSSEKLPLVAQVDLGMDGFQTNAF